MHAYCDIKVCVLKNISASVIGIYTCIRIHATACVYLDCMCICRPIGNDMKRRELKITKIFPLFKRGIDWFDWLSTQTGPGERWPLGPQLGSWRWVLQCLALFWHPPGHHSLGRIGPEVLKSWNEKTEGGLRASWATEASKKLYTWWIGSTSCGLTALKVLRNRKLINRSLICAK